MPETGLGSQLVPLLAGLALGALVGAGAGPKVVTTLRSSRLARRNFRGSEVVACLGLVMAVGLVAGLPCAWLLGMSGHLRETRVGLAAVLAGLAFTALGLIDDLSEDAGIRGFRGHLAALARGRVTGGGAKLLGGVMAAFAVAALAGAHSALDLLLGAVVVASAANVANLLDLRPARTAKLFLPLWAVGLLVSPADAVWTAGLAGAVAGTLPLELRETAMLGDAGANALGAVAGTLLLAGPRWGVAVAAAVGLGLQAISERVSFSRVIEGNALLARLDRVGRRRHDGGRSAGAD